MHLLNVTPAAMCDLCGKRAGVNVSGVYALPSYHFRLSETAASFSMGWAAFMCISPNVKEEGAMKEDTGTQDTPYTEVSEQNLTNRPGGGW